jgi:hypothetical protein
MRMTTFDPVGMVQAVFAAFGEVGCVTRAVPGRSRGSAELFARDVAVAVEDAEDDVDVALSSPNWICWMLRRS